MNNPLVTAVPLHRLGWRAFQDLCAALVEERVGRAVQTFLPTADAGRDGAFLGTWEKDGKGESTIQCKFTASESSNLTLSMLEDELPKARSLATKGLAKDYIILTNHMVTGKSDLAIKEAFQTVGVGNCRVFHRDWIIERIIGSPRLRMMVPRLYGLVDLSSVLDQRAYKQAQLILSEMGDNIQKLVVTDAHRRSVRAITDHGLVLLLGSPAAGKSTIGASLAIGAADIWKCATIKATSPERLEAHLDTDGHQFFWVDDAWGSTQYQRDRTEAWNQAFPLMQGALRKGTKFLITSRDYIWNQAKQELKIQALPILGRSQVIINVHRLSVDEKARILYNHVRLGDQPELFRRSIKPFLPAIAQREDFLPESARRLGNRFFTGSLVASGPTLANFFARPQQFMQETIEALSAESKAAIAVIFLNGGKVPSPVGNALLDGPARAFGTSISATRDQLQALNQSLLNLAEDEEGPYWTYRHPTISDAFAAFVGKSQELVDIYLRGARPETIVREVVCAGIAVIGAKVTVPNSMQGLLLDRIGSLPSSTLGSFISYRSNASMSQRILEIRPDVMRRLDYFSFPLKEDSDVDLLIALHRQHLLPDAVKKNFVEEVRRGAIEEVDSSLIDSEEIAELLTNEEKSSILEEVRTQVLEQIDEHVARVSAKWDVDYDPNDYFDELRLSVSKFVEALSNQVQREAVVNQMERRISYAVMDLESRYETRPSVEAVRQQSDPHSTSLDEIFRDVDG